MKKINLLGSVKVLELILLFFLLILAVTLRAYKINSPIADNHSWRQADTAAVARNFVKEGWSFLYPKIDNMTYLHSPDLPNSKRYFFVEPPIYQTIIAFVFNFSGVSDRMARTVTIFFSLGSIIFLYLISKHYFDIKTALCTIFFFTVMPYSIFYSRVILPEPFMIFLILGFLYFLTIALEKEKITWWVLTFLFASLALTQKIYPFFFVLPIIYLILKKYSWSSFSKKRLWLLLFFSLVPIFLWRLWISQFPQGIPPADWLLNQNEIRFKGAFFWWIFAERLSKLILGYWGLFPLVLGLILLPGKKEGWLFHLWFFSVIIYVTVFAAGNVTHDYYQIPFIPIISVFLGKGTALLLTPNQYFSRTMSFFLLIISVVFMLAFSWKEVQGFYNIKGGVDLAGLTVNSLTPKNALVLTGDSNDATLLYNTNRYGWTGGYASYFPNTPQTIEKIRQMNGSVYVTTKWSEMKDSDFGKYMVDHFRIVKETDQFIIFDISQNLK